MAALFTAKLGRQASGYLQDKYKQARLALGDVTPAELAVQEATNDDACVPDAKTLASIAEAAFDIDDYWRIANALRDLRGFTYTDDKGFDWGASMQRRADSVVGLLTDADRLKDARQRVRSLSFSHDGGSPTSSVASSGSSRASRGTWSFASSSPHYSDSPTFVCLCGPNVDYRHDKKFDAYTADDKRDLVGEQEVDDYPTPHSQGSWLEESTPLSGSPVSCGSARSAGGGRRASGFNSLSQPERRNSSKKLQRQLSLHY
uniref:ENTH domain-containing protein n=1 Tax=Aegilops tauschii TaxID=37682 RepID=N1R011_AEGTA